VTPTGNAFADLHEQIAKPCSFTPGTNTDASYCVTGTQSAKPLSNLFGDPPSLGTTAIGGSPGLFSNPSVQPNTQQPAGNKQSATPSFFNNLNASIYASTPTGSYSDNLYPSFGGTNPARDFFSGPNQPVNPSLFGRPWPQQAPNQTFPQLGPSTSSIYNHGMQPDALDLSADKSRTLDQASAPQQLNRDTVKQHREAYFRSRKQQLLAEATRTNIPRELAINIADNFEQGVKKLIKDEAELLQRIKRQHASKEPNCSPQ